MATSLLVLATLNCNGQENSRVHRFGQPRHCTVAYLGNGEFRVSCRYKVSNYGILRSEGEQDGFCEHVTEANAFQVKLYFPENRTRIFVQMQIGNELVVENLWLHGPALAEEVRVEARERIKYRKVPEEARFK